MTKPQYTIFDSSFLPFGSHSLSFGGDRRGESPRSFDWVPNIRVPGPIFYTDIRLRDVTQHKQFMCKKIALLIEPTWKPSHYREAERLSSHFDYILSHNRDLCVPQEKLLWYPHGGSWIRDEEWHYLPEKSKLVSMMISEKVGAPGHRLRHTINKHFGDRVDVYGRSINPIASKVTALRDYLYSIVIEPERTNDYFTEKIIDCLSQCTVPIYWGTPNICNHFDCNGIITLDSADNVFDILASLSSEDYRSRLDAILLNQRTARSFTCAEDYIFQHYPFLFQG